MSERAPNPVLAPAELPAQAQALVALNNAAVPAVNDISADDLAFFSAHGHVVSAQMEGRAVGLLVLLPPGVPYDSGNYAWFSQRYDRFLYVDRVVVGPAARGAGVGRLLYEKALALTAEAGHPVLLAEVNTRPPNPVSQAFHTALGFKPIIERENASSGKRVLMQERPIEDASARSGA